jgi:2,3-bisphosphoglycerate-independent phosphoglycerate mutase
MRVLLVFIDGIGYGRPGAPNPFDGAPIELLAPLGDRGRSGLRGVAYHALDATLGHDGLPQSATGQAALYTGENAAAIEGGHRSGYPSKRLAEVILARSVFRRVRDAGGRAAFLNAFDARRAAYLTRVARGLEAPVRRRAPSASTLAQLAGGGELATMADVAAGRAATFDLTGEVWRAFGVEAPRRTTREAARAVAAGAAAVDLAYFELFLTDKAGHAQDMTWARAEIVKTERFLVELLDAIDPREQLVLVTSDHGNLEDLSTRSHTRAMVPLLAYGAGAGAVPRGARALTDLAPRLYDAALGVTGASRSETP